MRKFFALAALFIEFFLPSFSNAAAESVPRNFVSRRFSTSGYFATINTLCIYDDLSNPEISEKIRQTWSEVKAILERVDQLISLSIPESDISHYNELKYKESIPVNRETVLLIELARTMHQKTEGYYDPTVFPLVDLWGFSPRFTYSHRKVMPYDRVAVGGTLPPPDPRFIDALRRLVGMEGVQVEGNEIEGYTLRKMTPSVEVDGVVYQAQIDLGGIAKGYVTDLVNSLLQEKGFKYGYFSSGTSSMRLLKSASYGAKETQDSRFHLEIRKPRKTAHSLDAYAGIAVQDEALSSSGDYDNNYLLDGDIYSHLINPFTGYPVNVPSGGIQKGISTVTLLSGSAAEDDAYTTALCLMGPKKAISFFNAHLLDREIAMVFFRRDCSVYEVITNIPSDRLIIYDPDYRLANITQPDGTLQYTGDFFERSQHQEDASNAWSAACS